MERSKINNEFYHELDEKWLNAQDHPIALLRAENRFRNPWIIESIAKEKGAQCTVLDIGCGAGFLTHALAKAGHSVHGLDRSLSSLEMAAAMDPTSSVVYECGDAFSLPYPEEKFDVVCAMDLLEHVENPGRIIEESSRILKSDGLFFFHTFSRNIINWLLMIKGMDWCFRDAPKDIHIYRLFINPDEITHLCKEVALDVVLIKGMRPVINKSFWKLIFKGEVEDDFSFKFIPSLKTGYIGFARKGGS